jgi:hypothetical protein
MKYALLISLLVLVVTVPGSQALAQKADAAQRAAELRMQLADVVAREAELKLRLEQLNEDIKPENIERSLAGYGSTRPEELRAQRRRQLQIEIDSVENQLSYLGQSRANLESSIASADALAYQQSAQGPAAVDDLVLSQLPRLSLWVWGFLLGGVAIVGVLALVVLRSRRPMI